MKQVMHLKIMADEAANDYQVALKLCTKLLLSHYFRRGGSWVLIGFAVRCAAFTLAVRA